MAATILAQALGYAHPAAAVAINAAGAVVVALSTPTMMTAVYNLSKRSPCVLRFQAAGVIQAGAPLPAASLVSILGPWRCSSCCGGSTARRSPGLR